MVLCVRDGEAHLADQLADLVAQERPPDELIVVDDGSVDDSPRLLDEVERAASFSVVRLRNDEPVGAVRAFEQGIAAASGEIIALCDQDDRWYPPKLRQLEAALADAELAFSDADLVDERDAPLPGTLWRRLGVRSRHLRRLLHAPPGPLVHMGVASGCALAFRAELRERALPIPSSVDGSSSGMFHDRWLALVAAGGGGVRPVDERLFAFRVHDRQLSMPAARRGVRADPVDEAGARRRTLARQLHDLEARIVDPGVRRRVVRAVGHVERRAALPASRWRRIPPVLGDLLAGRYHAHGLGTRAAARDLLRPGGA